jgi:hypothetical protein
MSFRGLDATYNILYFFLCLFCFSLVYSVCLSISCFNRCVHVRAFFHQDQAVWTYSSGLHDRNYR